MSKLASCNAQLLFLDQKCAKCLLDTYVTRSLSLNEGCRKHQLKRLKRVKRDEQGSQARRAYSDPSTHRLPVEKVLKTNKCPECASSAPAVQKKGLKTPSRSTSFFRGFLSLFSKKKFDLKAHREALSETDSGKFTTEWGIEGHCERSLDHTKALKKKHSLKKILLSSENAKKKESLQKDTTAPGGGEADVKVDSSNAYFEKFSQHLEWIVKEIQFSPKEDSSALASPACVQDCSSAVSSGDDITERIISLLKQQGDIIDQKISRNQSLHDFLQKLSYSAFQQIADRYIAQIPSPPPQITGASPELVKLAFTLDFTAKVAGLCSQTVGRIMGFGYQYLQDSFTQMCAAHRRAPEDLEGPNTCDPD